MELTGNNGYRAKTVFRINVLLGKNGCGKSTALKSFEQAATGQAATGQAQFGSIKYLTPERGGRLLYEPNVEQQISSSIQWLSDARRANRNEQFRQQSVVQFRKLEILALREIESNHSLRKQLDYTFDSVITKVNALLDNVFIQRADAGFDLYLKETKEKLTPEALSSGESELISLAVEGLVFSKDCKEGGINILFFDEPDVHLHPDLQAKLMKFICDLVAECDFHIFIATHSTAIVGALDTYADIGIHFMENKQKELEFSAVKEIHRKIIPVFGAHPLSSLFNKAPIFLVEGEDDVRIWQQAIRSSHGQLAIYPCSVDGIDNLPEWEDEVISIINSVYDDAKAYSLRDRDGNPNPHENLEDKVPLIRLRLFCRTAENLMLSDEVLASLGITWSELQKKIENWIDGHNHHNHFDQMCSFRESGYNRVEFDLKEIRNDLMGIIGSSKPWEVAIGQVIGAMVLDTTKPYPNLCEFLGNKTIECLQTFVSTSNNT